MAEVFRIADCGFSNNGRAECGQERPFAYGSYSEGNSQLELLQCAMSPPFEGALQFRPSKKCIGQNGILFLSIHSGIVRRLFDWQSHGSIDFRDAQYFLKPNSPAAAIGRDILKDVRTQLAGFDPLALNP